MEHSSNTTAKKYVSFKLTATKTTILKPGRDVSPGADRNFNVYFTESGTELPLLSQYVKNFVTHSDKSFLCPMRFPSLECKIP